MAKRFTDTQIWKKQKWFRSLNPEHKLIFLYIKDNCDHAGLWKVDAIQLIDDLGLSHVDLKSFMAACNIDHDPFTGSAIKRERIIIVNQTHLWLTGFVQFQYENKESGEVNPNGNFVKSALALLQGHRLLNEAIDKGYITLSEPLANPSARVKGKERERDKGNNDFNKKEDEKKSEIDYEQPSLDQVCDQGEILGLPKSEAKQFFDYYEAAGWMIRGSPIVKWRAKLSQWASRQHEFKPKYHGKNKGKPEEFDLEGFESNFKQAWQPPDEADES